MKHLFLILTLLTNHLLAYEFRGMVVKVSDGDTITVLDEGKVQHKIRMYGIDAPEKTQPYGTKSKEALSRRIADANNQVTVNVINTDRYGRLVAIVYPCYWHEMAGACTATSSLNEDQIVYGLAWAYVSYLKKRDKEKYILCENVARGINAGLWAMKNPTPPWKFRKSKRTKK